MKSRLSGVSFIMAGSRMTGRGCIAVYFILQFLLRLNVSLALLQTETLRTCPCFCHPQHSALLSKGALNAS